MLLPNLFTKSRRSEASVGLSGQDHINYTDPGLSRKHLDT